MYTWKPVEFRYTGQRRHTLQCHAATASEHAWKGTQRVYEALTRGVPKNRPHRQSPCVRPGPFLAGTTAGGIQVVSVAVPERYLPVLCASRFGEGQSDEEDKAEPKKGVVWYLSCPRGRRADI